MEVTRADVAPLRVGVEAVAHLPACGLVGGQRGVADRVPDQERVRCRQVDDVVIHCRTSRGPALDADVTVCPRTPDSVVDADVVHDRAAC